MKIVMTLAFLAFTITAQASSIDVACSSANASVRTAAGHRDSFIQVTERNYRTGEDRVIRDESHDLFSSELVNRVDLKNEQNEAVCRDGIMGRWARSTYVEEIMISRKDGGLFSENTMHVTPDRKAVKAMLLCEQVVTGIMPCKR